VHQLWRGAHQTLRNDIVSGALLLTATLAALVLANTPAVDVYEAVRDFTIGPPELHLDMSVQEWAADGLLAIFFFVVGLELKEELVVGQLRDPGAAVVPIAAALAGVITPAVIFVAITATTGDWQALRGWAIPAATDIAFAVAVLGVVGRFLPPALRVFLLTLAIVDDLVAITIIATFYTSDLTLPPLVAALLPLAAFGVLVQRGVRAWWLLLPLAATTWTLVHASGVHATVAGVLLALTVPVRPALRARVQVGAENGEPVFDGLAGHFADRWGALSSSIAVPVFAFFSAGVAVGGPDQLRQSLTHPIALGIIAGLTIGKPLGVAGATFLLTRLRRFTIDSSLDWSDLLGLSFLAGIGFTVALLVGELSYGSTTVAVDQVKVAVLVGSFTSALIGSTILAIRNRQYRHVQATAAETRRRQGPPRQATPTA
jgi:NhaA family Na+:H+ antiporter